MTEKSILAIGNKEEIISARRCPECGGVGLEYHQTGHRFMAYGEPDDNIEEWDQCPVCGWSSDGKWRGLADIDEPPADFWEQETA